MRTNIVLDDALVNEALRYANVKTKRQLVNQPAIALFAEFG